MFEQAFIGRTRRAWTVPVSFAGQVLLIVLAVVVPLLMIEPPRLAQLTPPFTAPPSLYSPRPRSFVRLARTGPAPQTAVFREPTIIPHGISTAPAIERPPVLADAPPCIGKCIEGPGDPGGVTGGMPLLAYERPIRVPPPPAARPPRPQAPPPPAPVPVGGDVQESRVIHRVSPVYPPQAVRLHITGTVRLSAIIGADGRVRELQVLSGHPWLVKAAVDAVRQWIYRPTLLNRVPVEVATDITVNFTLRAQ